MSSTSDNEIENMSQHKTYQKPKYVRRLNFGETILNLNTIDRAKGPDANKFIIDEKVEGIPMTQKEELVRNWIEIHNNDDGESSKESTQPTQESTLNASTSTSLSQPSPFLDIRKYMYNVRSESDYNFIKSGICNQLETSPILGSSKRMSRKRSNSSTRKNQIHIDDDINLNKNIFINNSEQSSSQNVIVDRSPVLVRDAYYYKRRYERFITKSVQMNNINIAINETDDSINRNTNLLPPNTRQNFSSLSPEICMSVAKQRKIDSDIDKQDNEIYESKNMIVPTELNSAVIEDNIIIKDSSVDKNALDTWKNFNSPSPEFSMSATKEREIYSVKDERDKEIYVPKNMIVPTLPNSSVIEDNVTIKNNTIEENTTVIESVFSDDSNTKEQTEITDLKSDDDEILNNLIEDTEDSKDMIYLPNNSISESNTVFKTSSEVIDKLSVASPKDSNEISPKIESNKNPIPYKIKTIWTIASLKDSNETFYSNTESTKLESSTLQNDHALEKISQETTFSNESVDNKSNQTNCFISTATSSAQTSSSPAMSLQILDSCKKRRRIKKKSLTAKLQSLVNRQTSFVRIWQHQIKQADVNGTSIPHVDVYVDKCTTHLHRQFLEGIVLNDPFNLLNNDNQEKSNLGGSSYKVITMIIVPDIVGKIEMKSESIVKIYPPWDVMDKSKSVLNITYIKTVSNEQRRAILNQINIPERRKEKVLIEESHCLCLEANKILSSCKERSNDERIDVMTVIYNF